MAFNVCTNRYANWHLNETSGTNVSDASGNGRVGTTVNTPTWVAGKLANCLNFVGGTLQYVNFGTAINFERTQTCSYEFWINAASGSSDILSKWDAGITRGMVISLNAAVFYFALATDGTHYMLVQTSKTVGNSAWHHVVITYNGGSVAAGVLLYVDGAVDASPSVLSNSLNGTILNSVNFYMAKNGNLGYFTGKLDEVTVYDRVLTAAEVTGRYNSGVGTQDCRMPSSNALMGHDF
jgi:hypothetical protein